VQWSIDENGLLDCTLDFFSISKSYSTGKMYVSAVGHKNYEGEGGRQLTADALEAAAKDVDNLDRALESNVSESSAVLRNRLTKQRETLKLSHDADTRRSVSEEARLIRQEVARIKNRPEFVRAVIPRGD
jgi:molecular chaperone DnaK